MRRKNSANGPMIDDHTAATPFFSFVTTCRAGSPTISPVSMAGSANAAQAMYAAAQPWRAAMYSASAPRRGRTDPPAVLRHAGADAELIGLQGFDAIGVDDDVKRGARDADQNRCNHRGLDAGRRIHEREIDDGRDDRGARKQQPGHALAETAEQRNAHSVDDPGPEHFEVVGQESERERGDGFLVDAVLGEARGQRSADHRVRKSRRDADKKRRQRFFLQIRREGAPQPRALRRVHSV